MENRIMRRRGRPCKGSEDNSPIRKTKTLRLTDAETKQISDNAKKCKMNFSEYCRKVLLNYQPVVPDPKFRDELFAVRKDITNFINFIHEPENYALFIDEFRYPCVVNPTALQYVTTKPMYDPDQALNCTLKADLGEGLDKYHELWQQIRFN